MNAVSVGHSMPHHAGAQLIDGRTLASELHRQVRQKVQVLERMHRATPGLAVIQVGHDAASSVYVRSKRKCTVELGMTAADYDLPASTPQAELLALIEGLNGDPAVNGILVQLPLPAHIDAKAVERAINPDKDVDGFHEVNVGRLWAADDDGLVPCTPLGCMKLLHSVHEDLTGLHAVVVGCSNIVGKPLASLLLRSQCTVSLAHEFTRDLPALCREADILAVATGHPELVRGDWIKPGATVIDVGINRIETPGGGTRLVGDVAFGEASAVAGAITPVPGGVGPMTIACLMENTVTACCRQHGLLQK